MSTNLITPNIFYYGAQWTKNGGHGETGIYTPEGSCQGQKINSLRIEICRSPDF